MTKFALQVVSTILVAAAGTTEASTKSSFTNAIVSTTLKLKTPKLRALQDDISCEMNAAQCLLEDSLDLPTTFETCDDAAQAFEVFKKCNVFNCPNSVLTCEELAHKFQPGETIPNANGSGPGILIPKSFGKDCPETLATVCTGNVTDSNDSDDSNDSESNDDSDDSDSQADDSDDSESASDAY